jgi:hypothetical protein
MLKKLFILCLAFFLIACGSRQILRYNFVTPKEDILKSQEFVIVPLSVIHEYYPSGDSDLDHFLQDTIEFWQGGIEKYIKNKLSENGNNSNVRTVDRVEFKEKLAGYFNEEGREGLFNPKTGQIENTLWEKMIKRYASESPNSTIIFPQLLIKNAPYSGGNMSINVRWDGVTRQAMTGGSKVGGFFSGMMGSKKSYSGTVPAYSLHVEFYSSQNLCFWSNGGFDIASRIGTSYWSASSEHIPREYKEVFGSKNHKNMAHCINVTFDPLFKK